MSEHYYSKQPQTKNVMGTISCTLRNHAFTFTTGSGVFSKKGIDYGSRLLIESFVLPNVEGSLLDLGCGYGPVGITLAKTFPARSIVMVDVNERAVSLAQQNAKQNDVSNVRIFASDGYENVTEEGFAAIITNPPIRAGKKTVYTFLEDSVVHLNNGGELWVVVQKKQGAPSMIAHLRTLFDQVDLVKRKKGYYVVRSVKGKGNN